MKPFRIETIALSEEEEAVGITVVIDAPYLNAINTLLYDGDNKARVIRKERGGTELWVELDSGELMTLFRELGSQRHDDPANIPGAYDSLTVVVYGLMDKE